MSDPADHLRHLASLDEARARMVERLIAWSNINSGSHHPAGLRRMRQALAEAFSALGPISPEHGEDLHLTCRPEAPVRILLMGHYDTVYGPDHPFQSCERLDENTLRGPGTADMKGGLLVMLEALRAFEQFPGRDAIGWEVFINADEEIGSRRSSVVFEELARRCRWGLVFEPAQPGGILARARPGSASYHLVARGRAAHAGRDFASGRNAIVGLSDAILEMHRLNDELPGAICNAGRIEGGGPINVVPPFATADFNIRFRQPADIEVIQSKLDQVAAAVARRHDVNLEWSGAVTRPPKVITREIERLFAMGQECAAALGFDLEWKDTGGCCDGNNLASAGLANLDTLGVRGGNLHSSGEYVELDSLTERAKLTALLLMRLAEEAE